MSITKSAFYTDEFKSTLASKVADCKTQAKVIKYSVYRNSAGTKLVELAVLQAKIATLGQFVEKAIPERDHRRGMLDDLAYAKKKCDFADRVVQFYKREDPCAPTLTREMLEETQRELEADSQGLSPDCIQWKVERKLKDRLEKKFCERLDEEYNRAFKDYKDKQPPRELMETWGHPVLLEQSEKVESLKRSESDLTAAQTCNKLEKALHRIASCDGTRLNIFSRQLLCEMKHIIAEHRKTLLAWGPSCFPVDHAQGNDLATRKPAGPFAALQFLCYEMNGYWTSNPDNFRFSDIPGEVPMDAADTMENAELALLRGETCFKEYSAKNNPSPIASIALMQASTFVKQTGKPNWVTHLASDDFVEFSRDRSGLFELEAMRKAQGLQSIGAVIASGGCYFGIVLYKDGTLCLFNPLGDSESRGKPCFVRFQNIDAANGYRGIHSCLRGTGGYHGLDVRSAQVYPIASELELIKVKSDSYKSRREAADKEWEESKKQIIESFREMHRERAQALAKAQEKRSRPLTLENLAPSAIPLKPVIDLLSHNTFAQVFKKFLLMWRTIAPETQKLVSAHMLRICPGLKDRTHRGERPFKLVKEEAFEAGDRVRAVKRASAEELIVALDSVVAEKKYDLLPLLLPELEKMPLDPRDVPEGMNPNIAYALFGQLYHTCNTAFKEGRTKTDPNTPDFGRQGFARPDQVDPAVLYDASHKVFQALWQFWWPRPVTPNI